MEFAVNNKKYYESNLKWHCHDFLKLLHFRYYFLRAIRLKHQVVLALRCDQRKDNWSDLKVAKLQSNWILRNDLEISHITVKE